MSIVIYCTGRPDNFGSPTHDRWEIAEMTWTGGVWIPRGLKGGSRQYAGKIITQLTRENELVPDLDELRESMDFDADPQAYSAALLEHAALAESARFHHSFACRIPLEHQRRGCGLNVPVANSGLVDEILTAVTAAGVSELSLSALARRVNPDT